VLSKLGKKKLEPGTLGSSDITSAAYRKLPGLKVGAERKSQKKGELTEKDFSKHLPGCCPGCLLGRTGRKGRVRLKIGPEGDLKFWLELGGSSPCRLT